MTASRSYYVGLRASPGLTTGDLQQFFRDVALPQLVVFERQLLDQTLSAVGGVLHRHHARALLARLRIQQHVKEVDVEIQAKQVAQDTFRAWFEDDFVGVTGQRVFMLRAWNLQAPDFADGKVLERDRFLHERVDETRRDEYDLVDFSLQKKIAHEADDRPCLGIRRRIAVRELGSERPAAAGDELRRLASRGDEHRGLDRELRRDPEHVRV